MEDLDTALLEGIAAPTALQRRGASSMRELLRGWSASWLMRPPSWRPTVDALLADILLS